jgi:hypothetical protein
LDLLNPLVGEEVQEVQSVHLFGYGRSEPLPPGERVRTHIPPAAVYMLFPDQIAQIYHNRREAKSKMLYSKGILGINLLIVNHKAR